MKYILSLTLIFLLFTSIALAKFQVGGLTNRAPSINWVEVVLENLGDTENVSLRINVTDPDGAQERNYTYFGSYYTSSYDGDIAKIDISDALSQAGNVYANDTYGQTSSFAINFTISDNALAENSSYSHSLAIQGIEKNDTIKNNAAKTLKYNITHSTPSGGSLQVGGNFVSSLSPGATDVLYSYWTGDWITGESESDVGTDNENSTYPHTLDTQGILNRTGLTVTNSMSFSFSNVDISSLCENTLSANVPTGTNQITTNCSYVTRTGDWITGETEKTYTQFENSSRVHNETAQWLINQTYLNVTNSQPFTFSSVDLSSLCENTLSANVPAGTNQITTNCSYVEWTGDWISESTGSEGEDSSQTHSLSTQYIYRPKSWDEVGGYSWTTVNGTPPSISGTCSNCNYRTFSLSAYGSHTEYYNASGDWITSEVEGTYSTFENSSASHTLDLQYVINQTELNATNSMGFTFQNVDLSSYCENVVSADVMPGTTRITTNCSYVEWTGDWITGEIKGEYQLLENTSYPHTIDLQGILNQTYLNVTNSGVDFTSVDISSECTNVVTANIPTGTNQITTNCTYVSFTDDRIEETIIKVEGY